MKHVKLAVVTTGAIAVLLVGIGSTGLLGGWFAHAQANTWVVNDDLEPAVDGCDTPHFPHIQSALVSTAVRDGDTIIVCEGTYQGFIIVPKSVTIEGRPGADRKNIVVTATTSDGLLIDANDVTVRHLLVDGPYEYRGIAIRTGRARTTIRDVEVSHWGTGIYWDAARETTVIGDDVHDNRWGMWLENGQKNSIIGSEISNNFTTGILMQFEDQALIADNIISGDAAEQIHVFVQVHVHIVRNQILTRHRDGIVISGTTSHSLVVIGGSPDDANTFSGPLDSGKFYVSLDCYTSENTVNATHNYWGTADRTEIGALIFNDEDDDPMDPEADCPGDYHGAVVFHPWATEPPPTPTPTTVPTVRDFSLAPPGWYDFVWTGPSATNPDDALACIEGQYSVAYRWLAADQVYERHVPGRPDISNMEPLDKYDRLLVLITGEGVSCQSMPVDP